MKGYIDILKKDMASAWRNMEKFKTEFEAGHLSTINYEKNKEKVVRCAGALVLAGEPFEIVKRNILKINDITLSRYVIENEMSQLEKSAFALLIDEKNNMFAQAENAIIENESIKNRSAQINAEDEKSKKLISDLKNEINILKNELSEKENEKLSNMVNASENERANVSDEECKKLREEIIQLKQQINPLSELAYKDMKTKILNTNAFNRDFIKKDVNEVVFTMFAVDYMRDINKIKGKKLGDFVIKSVAANLANVYGEEKCYRVSGDQFCIILTGDIKDAQTNMLKVKRNLNEFGISVSCTTVEGKQFKNLGMIVRSAESDIMMQKEENVKNITDNDIKCMIEKIVNASLNNVSSGQGGQLIKTEKFEKTEEVITEKIVSQPNEKIVSGQLENSVASIEVSVDLDFEGEETEEVVDNIEDDSEPTFSDDEPDFKENNDEAIIEDIESESPAKIEESVKEAEKTETELQMENSIKERLGTVTTFDDLDEERFAKQRAEEERIATQMKEEEILSGMEETDINSVISNCIFLGLD